MYVRDISPRYVASIRPEANLAEAAGLLWEHDCGILPVVDEAFRVLGVLTDRDICMALATRNARPAEVPVHEVMQGPVHGIGANDTASQALGLMRTHHVRRLPVLATDGTLEGILSLDDLILAVRLGHDGEARTPMAAEVIATQQVICSRPVRTALAGPGPGLVHR